MKKLLTLLLVLVLALGLTVPAMAFTSDDSEDEDHPFDLSIYLVEYDDNDLFGLVALPESDRGYAKNEIVAAVIELYVPKGENPYPDYQQLAIEGEDVDFDVTDNHTIITTDNVGHIGHFVPDNGTDPSDGGYYPLDIDTFAAAATKNQTFKCLVFAKVTGDEASITVKLVDGEGVDGFDTNGKLEVTLDGDLYTIFAEDDYYIITYLDNTDGVAGDETVSIYLFIDDDDHATEGMAIDLDTTTTGSDAYDPDDATALGVNTDGELGIVSGATIKTDGDLYDDIMDVYDDVVVDVFSLDYFLIGNYLRDSFFEDLVSADTISATVDIEPWTAYVTVPDNIVVDPPKTGDAASIMGFVMVALAGSGAVALRRRG